MSVSNESAVAARGAGLAIARLARQLEHGLESVDLSLAQYRILGLLREGSTASSSLADHLTVSPPSITAVVDGLVARGLVARSADTDDRRRIHLDLTDAGLRTLDDAEAQVNERLLAIAAFFEGADPDAAVSTLREWHTSLDGYRQARREAKTKAAAR
jgi:long-chain acyl-CoA synthetase